MGRFCSLHAKERTNIELRVKISELEKLLDGKDFRAHPAQYATLVRCRSELKKRGELALSPEQIQELRNQVPEGDPVRALEQAEKWEGREVT